MTDVDVAAVVEDLRSRGVDVIRVSYSDLLGVDRGRDVLLSELQSALGHGLAFCRAVFHTTPMGDVVPVAGGLDAGLPDIKAIPDLSTLSPLPWEPGAAWCLADTTTAGGEPAPEGPRQVARGVADKLREPGAHRRRRSRAGVLRPRACRRHVAGLAPLRRRARQRVRGRSQGRPARHPAHHAASPARRRAAGDCGQPRVQRGPVRDQPESLRARRRGRPGLPDEVRRPGDRPPRGHARDLHGQAVQRRGRQRLPYARLARRRERHQRLRRPRRARAVCPSPVARPSPASFATRRRSLRSSTPRSTPTSGSGPTRSRPG